MSSPAMTFDERYRAIDSREAIQAFLKQRSDDGTEGADADRLLRMLAGEPEPAADDIPVLSEVEVMPEVPDFPPDGDTPVRQSALPPLDIDLAG